MISCSRRKRALVSTTSVGTCACRGREAKMEETERLETWLENHARGGGGGGGRRSFAVPGVLGVLGGRVLCLLLVLALGPGLLGGGPALFGGGPALFGGRERFFGDGEVGVVGDELGQRLKPANGNWSQHRFAGTSQSQPSHSHSHSTVTAQSQRGDRGMHAIGLQAPISIRFAWARRVRVPTHTTRCARDESWVREG